MAKAREIIATLPKPSPFSQGRYIIDGYYIIGQKLDTRKVNYLNQLPEFRQLLTHIDENINPHVPLTYLESIKICDLKHERLYPDCNYVIGLRGPDNSIKTFRRRGSDNPLVQVQELVDFINRFSLKSC